jgi:hypothetical protein
MRRLYGLESTTWLDISAIFSLSVMQIQSVKILIGTGASTIIKR